MPNRIEIRGFDFEEGAVASLKAAMAAVAAGQPQATALDTTYHTEGKLSAIVPKDLTPGVYDVVVTNPGGGAGILRNGYLVRAADDVDLFADAAELWYDPPRLESGMLVAVGLEVYWQGSDTTLSDVKVSFYQGHPDFGGTLFGHGYVPTLKPDSHASTLAIPYWCRAAGDDEAVSLSVYAVLDPDNTVAEDNEKNNLVSRASATYSKADHKAAEDEWPPTINCAKVGKGSCEKLPPGEPASPKEASGMDVGIEVSVAAEEALSEGEGGEAKESTGVRYAFEAEAAFSEASGKWEAGEAAEAAAAWAAEGEAASEEAPPEETPSCGSGWQAYLQQLACEAGGECVAVEYAEIACVLEAFPGVRLLQTWVADGAGNVSAAESMMYNLLPSEEASINGHGIQASVPGDLVEGMSHFYIYPITAGHTVTAVLTPSGGDPDLYIWSPDAGQSWTSLKGAGEVDEVTFVAPQTGLYVMQIYGYADAVYGFDTGSGEGALIAGSEGANPEAKVPLDKPGLPPEQDPRMRR